MTWSKMPLCVGAVSTNQGKKGTRAPRQNVAVRKGNLARTDLPLQPTSGSDGCARYFSFFVQDYFTFAKLTQL